MSYGFCPEDWPVFHAEIEARGIDVADIERVEMRPDDVRHALTITVTLRSGRVESWSQGQADPRPRLR